MAKKAHIVLKEARKKYGYTQANVASWIGLNRTTYNRKETGKISIFADEFLYILREYNKRGPKRKKKDFLPIIDILLEE